MAGPAIPRGLCEVNVDGGDGEVVVVIETVCVYTFMYIMHIQLCMCTCLNSRVELGSVYA